MKPQYPPIQVVNRADEPTGGASLEAIHRQGLLHRIVYVIVEDPNGKILLQKRGPSVSTYANCWDVSAAGHVDEGETYQTAARRELKEELGLDGFELRPVNKFYDETTVDGRHLNRFCQVYTVTVPPGVALRPDPVEVADTLWATAKEIAGLIADHPGEVAIGLAACLEEYAKA